MSTTQVQEILSTLKKRREENKLNYYQPYKFQKSFHQAGSESNQRLLMAANRVGKSYVGAMEMSAHLTGLYLSGGLERSLINPSKHGCVVRVMKPLEISAKRSYLGNLITQEIKGRVQSLNTLLVKLLENQEFPMPILLLWSNIKVVGGLGLPLRPMKWELKNLWGRVLISYG